MLNIVVAFKAEANPIINGLRLKKNPNVKGYELYEGVDVQLIVSGLGREPAFHATIFLCSYGVTATQWLNFGVAGSAGYRIGSFVSITRIVDVDSKRSWQVTPLGVKSHLLNKGEVHTVSEMQKEYVGRQVYDMEASGFAKALESRDRMKRAGCLKLISDGPQNVENLTIASIKNLLSKGSPDLMKIVDDILLAN